MVREKLTKAELRAWSEQLDDALLEHVYQAVKQGRGDWTRSEDGRANSSDEYNRIVNVVFEMIRDERLSITRDDTGRLATARLIVSYLAHIHGFGPALKRD